MNNKIMIKRQNIEKILSYNNKHYLFVQMPTKESIPELQCKNSKLQNSTSQRHANCKYDDDQLKRVRRRRLSLIRSFNSGPRIMYPVN